MDGAPAAARPWLRHYGPRVPTDALAPEAPVDVLFERSAQRFPERAALVFRGRSLTYAQLAAEVARAAAGLARLGVGPGTRVAVHLPNLPQSVVAVLATLRLGGDVVMTNPLYVARELVHQWHDAEVQVAVTGSWLWAGTLAALRAELPARHYVIAQIPDYLPFPQRLLAPFALRKRGLHVRVPEGDGVLSWRTLVREGVHAPRHRNAFDEVALLQYTGGTTGVSKGVMLTHGNLASQVRQLRTWMTPLEDGREAVLAALPYFHVFGFVGAMLLPLSMGATIVLMPDPRDIGEMIGLVERHRISMFPAVPTQFTAINQFPGIERRDVSSVRVCVSGSAPLPEDTLRRFEELTGARICEGFGMTESSPCTHCNPVDGLRKIGSIGVPLPGTDARIVDPDDGVTDRAAGEPGELIVRGPQVMRGYWRRDDATAETVRDGWLYTGDLAVMDDDGFFRIVGRKKDLILCSGYNVYPDEIDRVLCDHAAVAEACSIGVPHPKRGESVKSFVVLTPGASATPEELVAHCRANLAAYKVPAEIELRASLPKSAVMKLLRRELRDEELRRRGLA